MRAQPVLRRRLGRNVLLVAGAATLAACVPLKPTPSTPPAEQPHGTMTFGCVNGTQFWQVPAGVTSVTVHAFGAEGGLPAVAAVNASPVPGRGGEITATVVVTPGDVMQVNVGCAGVDADPNVMTGGAGGFGGGGNGGTAPNAGGGGGGASTFLTPAMTPLVVAGGGGGAGNDLCNSAAGGGGDGGGLNGDAGHKGDDFNACTGSGDGGGGGGGGTQTMGGAKGAKSALGSDLATAGTAGTGGAGGADTQGGGGGGGGYYGGGGGAGATGAATTPGAGGGGGGSSFTNPGATGVTTNTGVRSGNGELTLTW